MGLHKLWGFGVLQRGSVEEGSGSVGDEEGEEDEEGGKE